MLRVSQLASGVAGAGGYNLELPPDSHWGLPGGLVWRNYPLTHELSVSKLAVGQGKGMQEPYLFSLNSRHVPLPWLSPLGLHSLPHCSQVYTCA